MIPKIVVNSSVREAFSGLLEGLGNALLAKSRNLFYLLLIKLWISMSYMKVKHILLTVVLVLI